jgi:hypothetical protein
MVLPMADLTAAPTLILSGITLALAAAKVALVKATRDRAARTSDPAEEVRGRIRSAAPPMRCIAARRSVRIF